MESEEAKTKLFTAARRGDIDALQKLLLENDRSLMDSQVKNDGRTCLHVAIEAGNTDVVVWLLDEGADTTIRTKEGFTAWDSVSLKLTPDMGIRYDESIDLFCAFVQREARHFRSGSYDHSGDSYDGAIVLVSGTKNVKFYAPRHLSRTSLFALLEYLSVHDFLEQSCQQIRRELCRFVATNNGRRYRESSCTFETHSLRDGAAENMETLIINDFIYLTDPNASEEAQAANLPDALATDRDNVGAPSSQAEEEILGEDMIRSSESNYLSFVMPIMFALPDDEFAETRDGWSASHQEDSDKARYCKRNKKDRVEFSGPLTLDEYSYPALQASVLESRNKDQTLRKRPKTQASDEKASQPERIVVDQIWIWRAQDKIIFTCLGSMDTPLSYLHPDDYSTSYGTIGAIIAEGLDFDQCDTILDKFQTVIVQLADEVKLYTEETGVESMGIQKEKKFFHDINDIREELSMIRRILSQQEELWKDFASNVWPEIWADCLNGRMSTSRSDAQRQDERDITKLIMRPRTLIQKRQRRVVQLDEDAERVERSVGIQLDLKRQHTSIQEAHATAVISAAAFGFAVITIVFTPLSFVMSLFALPIDRLQDNQIPSRWSSDAGMYSTNYIGTWAATTEIVSIALTGAATWLALEYGLNHRITKKTWDFLKKTPLSLKPTFENLKNIFSNRELSFRRKQKKEKDEENRETTEIRTSAEGRASTESRASRTSRVSRASGVSGVSRVSRASAVNRSSLDASKGKEEVKVESVGQ